MRKDKKQIDFVMTWLNQYDWVKDTWTTSDDEDYDLDCYFSTSSTTYGVEVKSFRPTTLDTFINENGNYNDYFRIGNTTGLTRNFRYCNCPSSEQSIDEIAAEYADSIDTTSNEEYEADNTPMPEEYKNKYVMVVNACMVPKKGPMTVMSKGCKWVKLNKENNGHNILVYMCSNGLMVFSNPAKAFIGYARMSTPHSTQMTTYINKDVNYELKALLDLSYAKFIPIKIDKNILR